MNNSNIPTQMSATWDPPVVTNGILERYNVTCETTPNQFYSEQEFSNTISFEQSNISLTTLSVPDLISFTMYECYVTASTEAGTGPPSNADNARTSEDAPSGPPRDFGFIDITSTSVNLTWTRPERPNGMLINYTLTYMNVTDVLSVMILARENISHVYEYMVMNLNEATAYEFELSATTGGGTGPNKTLSQMTQEDGMNLHVDVLGLRLILL